MVIIYDFDGTLTNVPIPQYGILEKCGYNNIKFMDIIKEMIINKKLSIYQAFYNLFFDVLKKNNYLPTDENICLGSKNVEYNNGVLEFFENLKYKNINHFIVTSGIEVFAKNSAVSKYMSKVFGTTFKYDNNVAVNVDKMLTDEQKVDVIRNIQSQTKCSAKELIYIGDGLTDKPAFEYVKNIGGTSIFLAKDAKENKEYLKLNKLGIISKCFESDFSVNKELYRYILNKYESEKA